MKHVARAALAVGVLLGAMVFPKSAVEAGPPLQETFNEYFRSVPITANGDYIPIAGLNCSEENPAFIFWYAPGTAADHLWQIQDAEPLTYTSTPMPVNGVYEPIVGDFDADGCDDIFWYGVGTAPDYVWWNSPATTFTSVPFTVNGVYEPVVSRFGESATDDIFWYSPGPGTDYFWTGFLDRGFGSHVAPAVNGDYDIGSLGSSLYFHRPGPGSDYFWSDIDPETGSHTSQAVHLDGSFTVEASVGGFVLYGPGAAEDLLLLVDLDEEGNVETVPGTINGTYVDDVRSPRASLLHVWHAPGPAPDYLWLPGRKAEEAPVERAQVPEFPGRG
ncbi:MAG: hypothetical protein OSA99_01675 [Acidimicrobiales bacterium]|nr:hypothetical protein [Acidimicrobiales bacterium]